MALSHSPSIVMNGLVLCLDAGNTKSYSQNVFPYPLDGYSWGTSGFQMTVSRDTSTSSPVGNSPLKLVTSGTSAYTNTYNSSPFTLSPAAQGQTWTFSFWVKGSSSFSASMMIFEANSSGNYTALGQPFYNVTTEWTRVSGSYTMTQATTTGVQVRIDCYVSGVTLWADGFQLEKASSASSFNSTSNSNGTTWIDLSGKNNNFTWSSPAPTYTTYNNTPVISTNPTYLSLRAVKSTTYNDMRIGNGSYTAFSFFRPNQITVSKILLSFGPANNNCNGENIHPIGIGPNGKFAGGSCGGLGTWNSSSGVTPTTDKFWNVCTTYDGTTENVYVNASLDKSASSFTNSTPVSASNAISLGWIKDDGASYSMDASIGTILIYNRALAEAEIRQNFSALRGRFGI